MIVWLADACAYFAGRLFGKNRMAPAISPKKTWEGVAGGLVSVLVAALAAYLWLPHEMVTVKREGDMLLQIAVPVSDEGKLGVIARNPYTLRTQEYTFWQSIPAGIEKAGKVISSYWEQLKMIVQPKTKMYEELGGFIAIGSIFPGDWNWEDFWLKTAFLSIILAVMNILPIPGLDGGHAIFTFWEMVTGRKVSDKVLEGAQYVGLVIILFLLLYANGNDIYRFFIK